LVHDGDGVSRIWDGRSSTLENEQALGVVEYARRQEARETAIKSMEAASRARRCFDDGGYAGDHDALVFV
jgi:hypothetical protein